MDKLEIWEAIRKPYIDELYDSPHFDHPVNIFLDFLDTVKPMKKKKTKGWFKLVEAAIKDMAEIQELLENTKAPYMDAYDLSFAAKSVAEIKSLLITSQNKLE